MGNMDLFTVKTTAKAVRRREVMLRVSSIVAIIAILLLLLFYCLIYLANSLGDFTVKIAEDSEERYFSLSESPLFENPTTMLHADILDSMDNITESWIDENVDQIDGPHNGKNYIAYTFYVKNTSSKTIDYNVEIVIDAVEKAADEAIRVKVYKNGESTVYAKVQKDSVLPEPNTTPFYSSRLVMSQTEEDFTAGEVHKYTVVVWLEGNDPECIDNIKGGKVKLTMNFTANKE